MKLNKIFVGIFLSVLLLSVVVSYGDTASAQYPKITPKVTIKEIHSIALDKTSYLTSETAKVTVTDYSFNKDSQAYDQITVYVSSKLFPTQKPYSAKETSTSSGTFVVNVKISDITTKADTLIAKYNYIADGMKKQGTASATITVPVKVYQPIKIVPSYQVIIPPTLSIDKTSYLTTESLSVTIKHAQSNTDPNVRDSFQFTIYSQNTGTTKSFAALETLASSGEFTTSVKLDTIVTKAPDTVTVALTGSYVNTKVSTTVSAPVKTSEPIKTYEPVKVAPTLEPTLERTAEQTKIESAVRILYDRTLEQTELKSTSELISIISQKESVYNLQKSTLLSKLSSGKDPSLFLNDREQYVRSKIDYLSEKGRYIDQGKATTEEINDFQKQRRLQEY